MILCKSNPYGESLVFPFVEKIDATTDMDRKRVKIEMVHVKVILSIYIHQNDDFKICNLQFTLSS